MEGKRQNGKNGLKAGKIKKTGNIGFIISNWLI